LLTFEVALGIALKISWPIVIRKIQESRSSVKESS
jgi:hypothetical protein